MAQCPLHASNERCDHCELFAQLHVPPGEGSIQYGQISDWVPPPLTSYLGRVLVGIQTDPDTPPDNDFTWIRLTFAGGQVLELRAYTQGYYGEGGAAIERIEPELQRLDRERQRALLAKAKQLMQEQEERWLAEAGAQRPLSISKDRPLSPLARVVHSSGVQVDLSPYGR